MFVEKLSSTLAGTTEEFFQIARECNLRDSDLKTISDSDSVAVKSVDRDAKRAEELQLQESPSIFVFAPGRAPVFAASMEDVVKALK